MDDRIKFGMASLVFASGLACACVARGAVVRTPNGRRRIEDIEVGDTVFSVDPETGELVATTVTHIKSSERECVELVCGNGDTLVCTSDHPVYDPSAEEYADAGDWVTGEREAVLRVDGEQVRPHALESAVTYSGIREVFDLTVDHDLHNFVANGFLVHNKSPPPSECQINGDVRVEGDPCECEDGDPGRVECPLNAAEDGSDPGTCECPDAGMDAASDADVSGDVSPRDTSDRDTESEDDTGARDADVSEPDTRVPDTGTDTSSPTDTSPDDTSDTSPGDTTDDATSADTTADGSGMDATADGSETDGSSADTSTTDGSSTDATETDVTGDGGDGS